MGLGYNRHFGYKFSTFGEDTKGHDVKAFGDTTGRYMLWDASADELILTDSVSLNFGTSNDVDIRWDGTDLDILALADDSIIKFGNGTNSFDIWIYGNTATEYILWDASADDLIFQDSVSLKLGTGGDVEARWDGTDLDILAAADDSVIKFGNGTNSFDVWVYGNVAGDYILWDASAGKLSVEGAAYLQLDSYRRTVTAKTADYTLTAADSGGVFTTTGAAGAVNFTLPAVATSTGFEYTFANTADQNITITAPAGTLVAFNNAAATSIAFSTASEKIGAAVKVVCDGAKWVAQVMLAAETQTPTIA